MAIFLGVGALLLGAFAGIHHPAADQRGILGGPSSLPAPKSTETVTTLGLLAGRSVIPDEPYNNVSQDVWASANGYLAASLDGGRAPSPISSLASAPRSSKNLTVASEMSSSKLKDLRNYFVRPAQGWNWGILHDHNAVDIANACGTPVKAAAEGMVVEAQADGWNGGYGEYLVLEHPNGTRTRYAHLRSIQAEVGNYLKQGQVLGLMGETGEATGCHLHFEVEGAKNPLAK